MINLKWQITDDKFREQAGLIYFSFQISSLRFVIFEGFEFPPDPEPSPVPLHPSAPLPLLYSVVHSGAGNWYYDRFIIEGKWCLKR